MVFECVFHVESFDRTFINIIFNFFLIKILISFFILKKKFSKIIFINVLLELLKVRKKSDETIIS